MSILKRAWRKLTSKPAMVILVAFAFVILVGTLILTLPISSSSGEWTSVADALFTATSATCVTGLIVQDTATYWSFFGQLVILLLIQIGGMGVVTMAVAVTMITGRKIGLRQRWIMQESIAAPQMGGILRHTRFILFTAAGIELTGAVLFSVRFIPQYGLLKGIWYSIFHAISAFCNAGFDLMGANEQFSSLTWYSSDAYVLLVACGLILAGGLGFVTWNDIKTHKLNLRHYSLQSMIVLTLTFFLLGGAFLYFLYEFSLPQWSDLSASERVLNAFFQAVTPRTAGFNAVDLDNLSETGKGLTIILMLIGCSSGSTGGGFKLTTLGVLLISMVSVFMGKKHTEAHHRRIPSGIVRNASALTTLYVLCVALSALVISSIEDLPLVTTMFETASAMATVGLSLGITPTLSLASRAILIALMFTGRAGGLTLMYAIVQRENPYKTKYPSESLAIG